MPTFHYQAWNAEQQPVTGELHAESVQEAITQLETRGLKVQSIGYAPAGSERPTKRQTMTDANAAREVIDRTILHAHLKKVLEEGKAITPALKAYSQEMPAGRRRDELEQLIQILERGDTADAENAFAELPDYWVPLLSAAVSSSDPGRILQEFIRESQRADELRRQWVLTLTYPLLIIVAAGAVLFFLSVLVIPIFRDIFKGFGLQLPWLTSLNLAIAGWITHKWRYILGVFLLLAALVLYLAGRRRSTFSASPSRFAIFGRTAAIARSSQFMADLFEAGLSVPDTLKVAGLLTNRRGLRRAVWRLADHLQLNEGSARYLQAPRKLSTVYYALRADMPTKSRIRLLREIARVHAEKSHQRLSWTRGMVEPAAITFIGLVVASVVVSLFLPLIKLIEGLSH